MEAWITKYALTYGIVKLQGRVDGSAFAADELKYKYGRRFFGNEFWLTKAGAIAHAEAMRQQKISAYSRMLLDDTLEPEVREYYQKELHRVTALKFEE